MSSQPPQRSVRIGADERGGWSSDRPRREGGPQRPPDISVRGRVLAPSDRLRYSPGSLVVIVSGSPEAAEELAARVVEDRGAILSAARVRRLLQGRVAAEEVDERAADVLAAAVEKRLSGGEAVVLLPDGPSPEEREGVLRRAASLNRPRHLILLEAGAGGAGEEARAALNDLRRAIDAGGLGAEGFHTALRLGGGAVRELKKIVFRPEPRED